MPRVSTSAPGRVRCPPRAETGRQDNLRSDQACAHTVQNSGGTAISGLTTEALVEVHVDDEAAILTEGVLDYVLRVGWATDAAKEPSQISLTVWNNGTRLDLQDEANALAGVDQSAYPLRYSVHLNPADYLGAWPGAMPSPAAG
jgi:hypothetical protein